MKNTIRFLKICGRLSPLFSLLLFVEWQNIILPPFALHNSVFFIVVDSVHSLTPLICWRRAKHYILLPSLYIIRFFGFVVDSVHSLNSSYLLKTKQYILLPFALHNSFLKFVVDSIHSLTPHICWRRNIILLPFAFLIKKHKHTNQPYIRRSKRRHPLKLVGSFVI